MFQTEYLLGYIGAILIGLVLGLLGGGGSILTVPIFVYLLHIDPVTATAYSLFTVGVSAFFGAIKNAFKKMIVYNTGIIFAIPTLLAVFLTRKILLPAIPNQLFTIGTFNFTKSIGIMLLFSMVMLLASYSMIKGRKQNNVPHSKVNYFTIILLGVLIGVIAGLVGAGGGFLIIPSLVIFAKLPMKKAVATSLMIIFIQSMVGFVGSVENTTVDWSFLSLFTSLSVIGIFLGIYLNRFIEGARLKKIFGWFVFIMGVFIFLKETLFAL